MRYRIWERFSTAARRAAATAAYGVDRTTTPEGCCPLGVAMTVDGVDGRDWTCPPIAEVAGALTADDLADGWGGRRAAIEQDAEAFVRAWDGNEIDPADLPALLEVIA